MHAVSNHARLILDSAYRESRPERTRRAVTLGVVGLLHVIALALLALGALDGSAGAIAIGAAVTAYLAGLRHAADCDHIAGIDNATRKFVGEGRRPTSVGLAFSLGHSTVVFLLALAIVAGSQLARGVVADGAPTTFATVGGIVAGSFLILIGTFNSVSLFGGSRQQDMLPRTFSGRLMMKPLARVRQPWHIFVLGFLFGLGFDTATLIGFLVLTAATATSGIGIAGVLALPVAFAAGMTLADTANGLVMLRLYANAMSSTKRPRFLVFITAMSVVSALVVGVIVLVGTLHSALGLSDPVTAAIASVNLEYAGFVLFGLFAAIWATVLIRRQFRPLSERS
ncbi:HoxN/HupN/NixA family nickel/cobalt transporter [Smaragdicoccus niigatensis]